MTSLSGLYLNELREIVEGSAEKAAFSGAENNATAHYTLTQANLDQLNGSATGPAGTRELALDLAQILSPNMQEVNRRLVKVSVQQNNGKPLAKFTPTGGAGSGNDLRISFLWSGISFLQRNPDLQTFAFSHSSSLNETPFAWKSDYNPTTGNLTDDTPDEADNTLLANLFLGKDNKPDASKGANERKSHGLLTQRCWWSRYELSGTRLTTVEALSTSWHLVDDVTVHKAKLVVMAQRSREAVFGGRWRQTMVAVGSYAVTIRPWRCGRQTDQRALARAKLVVK